MKGGEEGFQWPLGNSDGRSFKSGSNENGLSGTCPERSIKKQKENRRKK